MNVFGNLSKPLKTGPDRYDGCILAFWKSGMNTADIARKLFVHESLVANRLAKLRDGKAA